MPISTSQACSHRIREVGLKLSKKCRFRQFEVSYVGHLLTDKGVPPDPEKNQNHQEPPADHEALHRFLGMTIYGQQAHQEAFDKLKDAITHHPLLTFYDTHKPLILMSNATPGMQRIWTWLRISSGWKTSCLCFKKPD